MNIEEIKKQKLLELQQKQQVDNIKKSVSFQILTKKARERLNFLRITKPQLVEQIELSIMQAYSQGEIREKIGDEQVKLILTQITNNKKKPRTTRK
ncbi:MAG: hypothetical protein GOU97_01500 [Nanoarchaeota archaeon]|nr:hypothetical protein [Nanoarchaeota archaeon]